jgi:hypothetical protein
VPLRAETRHDIPGNSYTAAHSADTIARQRTDAAIRVDHTRTNTLEQALLAIVAR